MAVIEIAKIQVRRGQEDVTGVPRLDPGEFGWAEDTQNLYIGKRMVEGANNDDNARILTDKDLNNIFEIFGKKLSGSAASTSTYRYRDDLIYPTEIASTTTTIATKLDNSVSLTDFGPFFDNNITTVLQIAVNDLYANTLLGQDTVRPLKLPAGTFIISGVIDLPPGTFLVGDGIGITTLVLESVGTSMFRTVDKLGNHFEQGMMSNSNRSKDVRLCNMTLSYELDSTNSYPLISLDNTDSPVIDTVRFAKTVTTSDFVNTGVAIALQGSIGVDESTVVCKDIQIKNCEFYYLNTAVTGQGNVIGTVIEDNIFNTIRTGIKIISPTTTDIIPTDIVVTKNKFEFVYNEAIKVDPNFNYSRITSSDNQYYYVGNHGTIPDQYVDYAASAIFDFGAPGNVSLNDYFQREKVSENTGIFYFNPFATGNAKIVRNKQLLSTILGLQNDQRIVDIPLANKDQIVIIDYQLYNQDMSRKGKLTMNIAPDGYASVSDYYNYSEIVDFSSDNLVFSTKMDNTVYNYVTLTCSSFASTATSIEFTIDIAV